MGDGYHIIASVGETVLRVWFSSWVYLMLEGDACVWEECLMPVRYMWERWDCTDCML